MGPDVNPCLAGREGKAMEGHRPPRPRITRMVSRFYLRLSAFICG
jgi:hypothetical protein